MRRHERTGGSHGRVEEPPASTPSRLDPPARAETAPRSDPPPAKRNAADSQKRILDAAEQEFAKSGFAGARLREIASGAQVQPALIHHYFTDKRGLYEAVIRRALDHMSIASFRVLGEGRDLRGYLRGFVDLLVDFYEANQNLLAIMRAEAHSESDIFMSVVREKTQPILEAVQAMTETLMERGEVRSDLSPREILVGGLSLILYPIVDAPILGAVLPSPPASGDQAADMERRKTVITEMLLGSIRPPPPEVGASSGPSRTPSVKARASRARR